MAQPESPVTSIARSLALFIAVGALAGPVMAQAQTQQIPLELRQRTCQLQQREASILRGWNEWNVLVNDATQFFVLVTFPNGHHVVPVDVRALSNIPLHQLMLRRITGGTPDLARCTDTAQSVEEALRPVVELERQVRQQIRQHVLPELDGGRAQTRAEFAQLVAGVGPQSARPPAASADLNLRTEDRPPVDGTDRVDACVNWGGWCDQFAADRWCKDHGFAKARRYRMSKIDLSRESTMTLGDRRVCDIKTRPPGGCCAFDFITCTTKP